MLHRNPHQTFLPSTNAQKNNGITIGIPLFNEGEFIEEAVRSAYLQCEQLIISDNFSTDDSISICIRLQSELPNLKIIRHEKNRGAIFNFGYLLEITTTPYFMWLGGHDSLPEGYTSSLIGLLEAKPDHVLAFGSVKHVDRYGNRLNDYDYYYSEMLSNNDPSIRLHSLLRHLFDCSLLHGVFRTHVLKKIWRQYAFRGGDHVLLSDAILAGKFGYQSSTHLVRRSVHAKYSAREQHQRITGSTPKLSAPSYQQMQLAQYELIKGISRSRSFNAKIFRVRSYLTLVARFGPFSKSPILSSAEALFFFAAKIWRSFSRVLHRI